MKVILSVQSVRFPLTGIGRYNFELARGLIESQQLEQLRLFSTTRFLPQLPVAQATAGSSHRLKRLVQKSTFALEAYRRLTPLLQWQSLRGCGDYLYHSPNAFLPPFPGLKLATVHDLSPFTWRECHDPSRVGYLQRGLEQTLESADALITDSEFARCELSDFAGWPLHRIHRVALAAGPEFHPRPAYETEALLSGLGLRHQGYSLYVGTLEPRKNLVNLLDAYERLPQAVRQRWPLVLTGYQGWNNQRIRDRLDRAQRQGWARYLGFLPAAHLPLLYSGARVFAFPSLYEGFGLPVLEAMQSGIPVVCSDQASLPEVSGGAALSIHPQDVEGLSRALEQALTDESCRADLTERGRNRSAEFSWHRCVAETLDVYRSTCDERPAS